ncbi:hypothetical protein KHP57_01915 [Algiphilus sp. NNCM1]|uniref:hypothetical protein n=1 Tax=Algiphilus sp. TaxID=1872431 RepID=UPI001CA73228|nr:hypothetical protein [Algiphilus sp.]MBY8964446.1 hypothetical protein [Algiphilus acroporae]MCI5063728.1 hypothetical protein [Algiphilus sp.]MCI5103130.1 hypothetical protein [Algiphilus sp.]
MSQLEVRTLSKVVIPSVTAIFSMLHGRRCAPGSTLSSTPAASGAAHPGRNAGEGAAMRGMPDAGDAPWQIPVAGLHRPGPWLPRSLAASSCPTVHPSGLCPRRCPKVAIDYACMITQRVLTSEALRASAVQRDEPVPIAVGAVLGLLAVELRVHIPLSRARVPH